MTDKSFLRRPLAALFAVPLALVWHTTAWAGTADTITDAATDLAPGPRRAANLPTYTYKVATNTAAPKVNEMREIKDAQGNVLVAMVFGGWQYGNHKWAPVPGGTPNANPDSWKTPDSNTFYAAIDGFQCGTLGVNDAADEGREAAMIHGETRHGWFQHQEPVKGQATTHNVGDMTTHPFTLPCRGSFMTFNCTKNGQLTIYILQNGAWNLDSDGKTKARGKFRPHSFYLVNQRGLDVIEFSRYNTHTVNTNQKVTGEFYCDLTELNWGEDINSNNVARWPDFRKLFSKGEQQRIAASWSGGTGGQQKMVELDDGSYLAIQKGIVKYTFRATGNETYYFFSNFSKMGFCGATFTPDAEADQPKDHITLSDTKAFTMPHNDNGTWKIGNQTKGNVVNVPAPQFKSITLNRTFKKGQWNTLSLPFDLTQDEVKRIFGYGTQLIMLNSTTSKNGYAASVNLHFIYHEIQNVLPGYPYLIKPTLQQKSNGQLVDMTDQTHNINNVGGSVTVKSNGTLITSFTVNNKYINPYIKQTPLTFNHYTATCTPGYSTATEENASGTTGYSARYGEGDIFISDGDGQLWVSKGQSYGKGYRSYIQWTPPTAGARPLTIEAMDYSAADDNETLGGQPTAITVPELSGEAHETPRPCGIYNLQGQRVTSPAKGIYIINGKKTILR